MLFSIVFFAYIFFLLGYMYFVRFNLHRVQQYKPLICLDKKYKMVIFTGAIFLSAYSLSLMQEYDTLNSDAIIKAIFHPGEAYNAKFGIYQIQLDENRRNAMIQICTIFYFLYYVYLVTGIFYWRTLNNWLKGLYLFPILLYIVFFLSIGTNKGIGDIIIICVAALLLRNGHDIFIGLKKKKANRYFIVLLISGFICLMGYTIASRTQFYNVDGAKLAEARESFFGTVLPDEAASFFYMIATYPTLGYAGLAYSLEQDYEFSYFNGTFPALHSYAEQFLGMKSDFDRTYMAMAERNNGWPALMYWHTILPWIASDITFFGAILMMFYFGWLFAWSWFSSILTRDLLSMLVYGQMVILIVFIPANNQLFWSRTGTWGFIGTCFLYVWKFILQKRQPSKNETIS